jgi:uracil-DNA glycosylase
VTDWDPLRGTDWNRPLRRRLDRQYWANLQAFVEGSRDELVYPPVAMVFAALRLTPLAKTKVVIVGQDPYPGAGQANGLAFAVPPGVEIPRSLANIRRELHCDVCVPIPQHGNLEPWARKGVLLLNSTLTVRAGAAVLHRRMWKPFTDAVVQVAEETDPVFILWGKVAQNKTLALIDASRRTVIKSPHPSPRSAHKGFFGSKPFSRANQALLDATGNGIDWRLTD